MTTAHPSACSCCSATPFAEISAQSMLPYAHLLWASVWHGVASDAVARSEAFVRA